MSKRKFDAYEKKISERRRGEVNGKKKTVVPSHMEVQRMSGKPNHLKTFKPLNTRDFVNFSSYDEMSIENLKETCEGLLTCHMVHAMYCLQNVDRLAF